MSELALRLSSGVHWLHYLPIVTTVLSALFLAVLWRAALVRRSGPHLWWWAAGVFFYGLGTGLESAITLFDNSIVLNKSWYIAGALLGGYPLAQGVVYLLCKRKFANTLSYITLPFIVVTACLVAASPVDVTQMEVHRPSGAILEWSWIRLMTPFINLYAMAFLVGGAILSAKRFAFAPGQRHRVFGNVYIAVGGLLPGIGGMTAKAGHVEALYVGELTGLCLIWLGYAVIAGGKQVTKERTELAGAA